MSKKRAYYLEFPERHFEVMIKEDGETQEIWTSSDRRPHVFMRLFEKEGYEVLGFKHKKANEYDPDNRYYRWERIDLDSLPPANAPSPPVYHELDEKMMFAYTHDYCGFDVPRAMIS